jgi:hypothetical protein
VSYLALERLHQLREQGSEGTVPEAGRQLTHLREREREREPLEERAVRRESHWKRVPLEESAVRRAGAVRRVPEPPPLTLSLF